VRFLHRTNPEWLAISRTLRANLRHASGVQNRSPKGCTDVSQGWSEATPLERAYTNPTHLEEVRGYFQEVNGSPQTWRTNFRLGTLAQVFADCLFKIMVELHDIVVIERQDLNHQDRGYFSFGIDPEVRVIDAGPRVASGRPQI